MINPRQVQILIADENSSVRELLVTRFAIFGFQTLLASTAEEAWQKIRSDSSIKILVTGLSKPGMDSHALIKKCKEANPESPRIFAIAGTNQFAAENIFSLGAEGILHQPFDARNLLNITRNSLLNLAERLRYPPYIAASGHLQTQHPNLKSAAPNFILGRGGFYVSSEKPLPALGQVLSFDFELGEVTLVGNGVLRWCRGESAAPQMAGVEFTYLKPKSIQSFQAWIEKNPTCAFIPSPQSVSSMPSMAKLQSTG